MWANHWHLRTPRTPRSCTTPTGSMLRKRLLWQGPPLPSHAALLLWWVQASSAYTPSCGSYHTPAPSVCLQCSQPQSSPQICPLKPKFQPPAPTCTSGCDPLAGECREVTPAICSGLSLFCLLQTISCVLLQASEAPFLSCIISSLEKGLPRVREPFLFHSSLPGVQVSSQFFFSFVLPSYMEIFLAILAG